MRLLSQGNILAESTPVIFAGIKSSVHSQHVAPSNYDAPSFYDQLIC